MSAAAEIADNKWELESTKPPVKSPGAIGQILLIGGLGVFFLVIIVSALLAIVNPPEDQSLAEQYKHLNEAAAHGE